MLVISEKHFFLGYVKPILGLLLLIVLIPVVVIAGRQAITLLTKAEQVPANIVVDASASQGILQRPWVGLSQGGEQEVPGTLVSISPVAAKVKALQIKYIRVDHLLEEPFWATHRQKINEIIASAAIPFISLSYFPQSVSGSNIGTVYNWDAWQARVKTLVEEVSGRGGMNLSNVYYEVWNEPDGPGFGSFNIGEGKDYFILYQKTVQAALSVQNVNAFKIGGPALADLRRCTSGALFICRTFWLDRFLQLVSQNNTRLDFISWHRYSTRLSDYQEDTNFILSLYNKYSNLPPAEKIITEWGSDPARNPIHDGVFDAAHLVATARTFIGYVGLATKFEVRDGPDSGNKGWGILYYNGAEKPTYVALKLLNLLRPERVFLSGEGTEVTGIASRDSSGVTIILANYDRTATSSEIVPVLIKGLIPGRYRLTKQTISRLYPLGKQDPGNFSTTDGTYSTQETMLPNSVVLYDLQLTGLLTGQ